MSTNKLDHFTLYGISLADFTEEQLAEIVIICGEEAFKKCQHLFYGFPLHLIISEARFDVVPYLSFSQLNSLTPEWFSKNIIELFPRRNEYLFFDYVNIDNFYLVNIVEQNPDIGDLYDKFLDGAQWLQLLMHDHARFTKRVDWTKLTSDDWVQLLPNNSEYIPFIEKIGWDVIKSESWVDLLSANPSYIKYCNLNKLDSESVYEILKNNEDFLPLYKDVNNLNPRDLSRLISYDRETYEPLCSSWDKFDGLCWSWILYDHPDLSKYISDWDIFNGEEWADLLSHQPQFAPYCNFDKLSPASWTYLIDENPLFLAISEPYMIRNKFIY